jgi:hypothetical protein
MVFLTFLKIFLKFREQILCREAASNALMQNGFVQPYSSNGLFWPRSSGLCCFCSSLLPFFCDHIVFTLSSICCRCPCTWTSFLGCVNRYSMTASLHFCRLYVIRTFLWKCLGETLQIGDLCNTSCFGT